MYNDVWGCAEILPSTTQLNVQLCKSSQKATQTYRLFVSENNPG